MSENVQENKEPQSTDTPGFTPINSQEELDRIIGNRLAREREKFSDYETLKEKAGKLAEIQIAVVLVCCRRFRMMVPEVLKPLSSNLFTRDRA